MVKSLFRKLISWKGQIFQHPSEKLTWPGEDWRSSTDLRLHVEELQRQLEESRNENHEKDNHIKSLEKQIERTDSMLNRNEGLDAKLTHYLIGRADLSPPPSMEFLLPPKSGKRRYSLTNSVLKQLGSGPESRDHGPEKLPKVQRVEEWLLDGGIKALDMESLLTQYAERCLSIGIPLDRLVVFTPSINHRVPSFSFKWEFGKQYKEKENHSRIPEEPLALLVDGTAMDYRMKGDIAEVPEGCRWFKSNVFQDYLALPIYHAGGIAGAMSWSTKATGGFREGHVKVLNESLPSLSALICCFVKDLVVTSLIERLEDEIQEQTMELAAANSCLAKANKRIMQQAESQLRNFAMMSHEIRTPLNCIIGMSNLLLHSDVDEDVKESIEMITSSGDLLLAVVDDVLDYSKLATGKVETRIEMTQITQVIRTVVASVQIRAKITGVDLETNLAATLPSGVETDGRRLQQILYNLLGNAIKFGREGRRVEFDVELVRRGSLEVVRDIVTENATRTDDDLIRFSIKDYGKGVQPSDIEKIFQPFQQAATHDPTVGGTGLGLAITNQLVRVLGGTISVESVYGSWCKFVVLLPVTSDRPIVSLRKEGTDAESVALLDQCQFSYHSSRTISVSTQPRDHSAKNMQDDDSWSDDDSYSSLSTSTPTNSHSRSTSSKYLGEPIIHAKDHGFFSTVQMELSTPRLLPVEKPHEEENVTSKSCEMQSKTFSLNEVQDLLEQSRRHSPLTVTPTEEELAPRALVVLSDCDVREHSIAFAELRILIAEDNKINQKVLNQTLMRMGLRDIDIVDDGKKAVEAFDTKEYDVIFMDLQMPVMDGLEATYIISSKKRARGIEYPKVAFLTAHAMVDYQDRAAAAGGDGFVSKPYKYDVLKELVIRFMESRQRSHPEVKEGRPFASLQFEEAMGNQAEYSNVHGNQIHCLYN